MEQHVGMRENTRNIQGPDSQPSREWLLLVKTVPSGQPLSLAHLPSTKKSWWLTEEVAIWKRREKVLKKHPSLRKKKYKPKLCTQLAAEYLRTKGLDWEVSTLYKRANLELGPTRFKDTGKAPHYIRQMIDDWIDSKEGRGAILHGGRKRPKKLFRG